MAFEFKLPEIGEGIAEAEIVKWLATPGQVVEEDQPILEVMTDKASMEVPCPRTGILENILVPEGSMALVGGTLATIVEKEAAEVISISKASAKTEPLSESPKIQSPSPTPVSLATSQTRVLASPATRKLAREMNLALENISGTGPAGRITKQDLMAVSSAGSAVQAARPTPVAEAQGLETLEERIPLRGIRKKIAQHMVKSKHTAPHFSQVEEVDFSEVVKWRNGAKAVAESKGIKLSFLPLIIAAVVSTLKKFPELNASLDDEREEIVIKRHYDIGIAVATKQGLVVPVIHDADQKNLLELASAISDLAEKARSSRLTVKELSGGTFTITSTGASGGIFATPIINHPEVAILGIHRIRKAPKVDQGQIVIADMGYVSLSLDHRVVDGAVGADFLQELVKVLQTPSLLWLESPCKGKELG